MVPVWDEGNFLQSPRNPKIMGARALEAWYIGIAWDHYRCLNFQVPTTWGIHVSIQYKIFQQHSHVPIETQRDAAKRVVKDLIKAVKGFKDQETTHPGGHTQTLEILTKISTIQHRNSLRVHRLKTKTSQTRLNHVNSIPRHTTINGSHNLTHRESYQTHSRTW